MTVKELAAACGFDTACGETVMGNLNSIAVAVLADTACIVLAEGMALDDDARAKSQQQDVTVLTTPLPVYEASVAIAKAIGAL